MELNWHERFLQQAAWTESLRQYLYHRAGLEQAVRVLDVGCGTGVLLAEILRRSQVDAVGVDLDPGRLKSCSIYASAARLAQANGMALPFAANAFDIALCHFLLLWVKDPLLLLSEMKRVVRSGGAVLALAEPDYGGRIDYPESLAILGKLQQDSLLQQGADPQIGRKLKGLFHQSGFSNIEAGILGAEWVQAPDKVDLELEWAVLQDDIADALPQAELEKIRSQELASWKRGERILFVPTFYAWGQVFS